MLHARARWDVEPVDEDLSEAMSKELDIHPIISKMLIRRGVKEIRKAPPFPLNPSLADLNDPFLLDGMETAVQRIRKALRDKEPILVYGDYDVDGVSSTCLMLKTLRRLGATVDYYIPHRFREGYGINKEALKTSQGARFPSRSFSGYGDCRGQGGGLCQRVGIGSHYY